MQYAINIRTFIQETDSGFTLATHPLGYEPYDSPYVRSSVEIPPLERKIVTQMFYLLLYIYNL